MARGEGVRPAIARGLRAGLIVTLLIGALYYVPMASARTANVATATLRIWYGTDDPTEGSFAQALAARFQAAHPGVKVDLSAFALDDINAKMQLALSSGMPPDLVYTTPRGPGLPSYVRAGQLLDLTAVARREGWDRGLRPGLLASYNDLLAPSGHADGHVYAAPYALAAVAMLYNQAIFQRLHLTIPHSMAALEAMCVRVKAAGLTPIGFGNADGWLGDDWYLTLVNAQTGPAALLPELRRDAHFSFSAPAFQTAGVALQRWSYQGYFTPQFGGLDAQDSVTAFFDGHTAMQLISSTQNGQIVSLARQTHIPVGIFAFPSVDARRAPVMPQSGYAGWAVPRAGQQPALAEAFITQMLSDATARALLDHGLLPARPLAAEEVRAAPPLQQAFLRALATATPGVYLDGAPVPNLNATMEANVQLLLQHFETPGFLVRSLQIVYDSDGKRASSTRTDGEF